MTEMPRLDAAVRAFRRDNPMRWPCACIGCVVTIARNYRALGSERPVHAAYLGEGAK